MPHLIVSFGEVRDAGGDVGEVGVTTGMGA